MTSIPELITILWPINHLGGVARVNFRTAMLIAVCAVVPLATDAQQTSATPSATAEKQKPHSSFTTETAIIEEVVSTEDNGYRLSAYVVRWHNTRVLVSDPLAATHLGVGNSVHFLVSRHDVGGSRILSFNTTGREAEPRESRTPKQPRDSSFLSEAASGTGLVEEVLSAEDEGYRFVAYIVQWHGTRAAISDPLARSRRSVGDDMAFLVMRSDMTGSRLLVFLATPPDGSGAVLAGQLSAPAPSVETGVIDEVLSATVDGYTYLAYVVQWLGSRVVVSDIQSATHYQAGNSISFVAHRIPKPLAGEDGILSFEPATESENPDTLEAVRTKIVNDAATVDEVLTTQTNGYRYVAYIVKWHNARVAISDMMATTHYAVGDRIAFPVARTESSGRQQLLFQLFNFEHPKSPESQQCEAPVSKPSST